MKFRSENLVYVKRCPQLKALKCLEHQRLHVNQFTWHLVATSHFLISSRGAGPESQNHHILNNIPHFLISQNHHMFSRKIHGIRSAIMKPGCFKPQKPQPVDCCHSLETASPKAQPNSGIGFHQLKGRELQALWPILGWWTRIIPFDTIQY